MSNLTLVIGDKNLSSWSLRPWLALRHFEIPFQEKLILLDKPDTHQNILKYSPAGKVPALLDDNFLVWDSLAILEYLADKFPQKNLWPKDSQKKARARSISNEMHSSFVNLRTTCPMKCKEKIKVDFSKAQSDIDRIQEIWNDALKTSGGPYLFGEFSIADCMYAPVVFRFNTYGIPVKGLSQEYVSTMLKHPKMQEWVSQA